MPRYHALLHRERPGSPWEVAFGDYSKRLVESELEYHARARVARRNQRIVTTTSIREISAVVTELNCGVVQDEGLDPAVVEMLRSMERVR